MSLIHQKFRPKLVIYYVAKFKVSEASITLEDAVVLQELDDQHVLESSDKVSEKNTDNAAKFEVLETSITDAPAQSLEKHVVENEVLPQEAEDEHVPESSEMSAEAGNSNVAKVEGSEASIKDATSQEYFTEKVVEEKEAEIDAVLDSSDIAAEPDITVQKEVLEAYIGDTSSQSIVEAGLIDDQYVIESSKESEKVTYLSSHRLEEDEEEIIVLRHADLQSNIVRDLSLNQNELHLGNTEGIIVSSVVESPVDSLEEIFYEAEESPRTLETNEGTSVDESLLDKLEVSPELDKMDEDASQERLYDKRKACVSSMDTQNNTQQHNGLQKIIVAPISTGPVELSIIESYRSNNTAEISNGVLISESNKESLYVEEGI